MKAQFDDMSGGKLQNALIAQGAVITSVSFGIAEIEFPEGTLSMDWKNTFGSQETYYLLPDGQTMAWIGAGVMGTPALRRVSSNEAPIWKQEILKQQNGEK